MTMRIAGVSGSPVKEGNLDTFLLHIMIPATVHSCASPLGASALSSRHGAGIFDPAVRVEIQVEIQEMELAELIHPSGQATG